MLDGAGAVVDETVVVDEMDVVDELTPLVVEPLMEEFCVWLDVEVGTTSEPSEVTREMVVVGEKYVASGGIISPPPVTELESVRTADLLKGALTVITVGAEVSWGRACAVVRMTPPTRKSRVKCIAADVDIVSKVPQRRFASDPRIFSTSSFRRISPSACVQLPMACVLQELELSCMLGPCEPMGDQSRGRQNDGGVELGRLWDGLPI